MSAHADDSGTPPAPAFFERLISLSREAHGLGRHEVAYHALCAAMHAAEDDGDRAEIATVEQEATAQIRWIDEHASWHRLSTASATRHDRPGVYAMLGRVVEMKARMLARAHPGHRW